MSHKSTSAKPILEARSQTDPVSGPSSAPGDFTAAETSVRSLISNARHKIAVERAKEIHKTYHSAASEALLVDAYVGRIQELIGQDLAKEANALIDLVRQRYPGSAERLVRLSFEAAARAATLEQLVAPLNDPLLPAEHLAAIEVAIERDVADLAALAECTALSPDHPLRHDAASLSKAFEAVTTGQVSEQDLSLPGVSRRSPLAPWKMLIWSIAAFYRRDDNACRRCLDAIKLESAPARLVRPICCLLDGKIDGQLPAASADLVCRVHVNTPALQRAIEALDREFELAEDDRRMFEAMRAAVESCRRHAPAHLERLKQHISVRAAVEELDISRTQKAMGGASCHDAYFYRLLALGFEHRSEHPADILFACATWNQFRLQAVEERWFAPNGIEVAALYLHMAKLLHKVPEAAIESLERLNREKTGQTSQELFYAHPQKLYERACALDPHSDAFSQWFEWARTRPFGYAEQVAEAWHKILPQDLKPILFLMTSFEERDSFPTALQYLLKAERIDGVNPEVRKARLRLLAGNAIRCLRRTKPQAAEEVIKEICALPQAQQGDRPAFIAALRYVAAWGRGDGARAQSCQSEIERVLGGPVATAMLTSAVALASKRGELIASESVQKRAKHYPTAFPAALARITLLSRDVQLPLRIPREWMNEATKQFRRAHRALEVSQLEALGDAALEANDLLFAYAVSAAGLERGSPTEAQFLWLRARCLPEPSFERRMICATAAAKLARQHGQGDLAQKAFDLLRGPFKDGSIDLTPAQLNEVLKTERKQTAYPRTGSQDLKYRSIIRGRLCPCPDCRRERGETVDELDEDDLDEIFDDERSDENDLPPGLEIPDGLPPEVASVLLEEAARAIDRGESLEQFLAHLMDDGLPVEVGAGRKRRRR